MKDYKDPKEASVFIFKITKRNWIIRWTRQWEKGHLEQFTKYVKLMMNN
jgi:hypothetical protein